MSVKSVFKKWQHDEDGATAIVYAICLPVLIGMGALAVEAGHLQQRNARIQSAADMAAVAAALEFQLTSNRAKAKLAGKGDAYENGYISEGGKIEVESPITSGPHAGNEGAIVRITQAQESYFSNIFPGRKDAVHVVEATVITAPGQPVCALSLHPTNTAAMSISGSANLEMESCAMHANSTANEAFSLAGSGTITADCISATGTVSETTAAVLSGCSAPENNQPPITDPYADIAVPNNVAGMSCESPVYWTNKTITMKPGRYCSNKNYGINEPLYLTEKGVYIFDGIFGGSSFFFKRNGSMHSPPEGVTIILMNGAGFENTNGGVIELYAQTDGPYAGVIMYADRETSDPNAVVRINGNQGARFEGALYFPTQKLDFRGGADLNSDCTQIIASQIEFSGNSALTNNDCGPRGTRSVTNSGSGVKLVN